MCMLVGSVRVQSAFLKIFIRKINSYINYSVYTASVDRPEFDVDGNEPRVGEDEHQSHTDSL